jgi:hypothetical protein
MYVEADKLFTIGIQNSKGVQNQSTQLNNIPNNLFMLEPF